MAHKSCKINKIWFEKYRHYKKYFFPELEQAEILWRKNATIARWLQKFEYC